MKSLKTIDLSNFNDQNITDMSNMFEYFKELETINLSKFNA